MKLFYSLGLNITFLRDFCRSAGSLLLPDLVIDLSHFFSPFLCFCHPFAFFGLICLWAASRPFGKPPSESECSRDGRMRLQRTCGECSWPSSQSSSSQEHELEPFVDLRVSQKMNSMKIRTLTVGLEVQEVLDVEALNPTKYQQTSKKSETEQNKSLLRLFKFTNNLRHLKRKVNVVLVIWSFSCFSQIGGNHGLQLSSCLPTAMSFFLAVTTVSWYLCHGMLHL